jgi:hypothetical protein
MSDVHTHGTPHRREFVRGMALGAAGLLAAEQARRRGAAQEKAVAASEKALDPAAAEVEARMTLILARYAERLDDEALAQVRDDVESAVRRGHRLKEIPLDNGDGPCPVFVPFRAPPA